MLRGPEGAVDCITRSRFSLFFSSEPHCDNVGWCSVFLIMVQFVARLLLIPQGTLFDEEKIQRAMLMARVLRRSRLKSIRWVRGSRWLFRDSPPQA